jgi:formylglycine-generating enzyme required for sulfatase activity
LPTEAEWEYACRAGATTSRYFGEAEDLLRKYAWYARNAQDRSMLPGRPDLGVAGSCLKANDFGLFDMLGNALEWCEDRYAETYPPDESAYDRDPVQDKHSRVMRGGSFTNQAVYVRSAVRSEFAPTSRRFNLGFRVVRTFPVE